MAAAYSAVVIILSFSSPLISASDGVMAQNAQFNDAEAPNSCSNSDNVLHCEIQGMKLMVARLELLLEATTLELHTKSLYIDNCEKKVEDMSDIIQHLETVLSNLKGLPDVEEMITVLEAEAQELEVGVRKNEKELQRLRITTEDAENWVKLRASEVETMSKIVPELWFHVQKLEQACEVIEFINNLPGGQYQQMVSAYMSKAASQLRRSFSAVKKYHHQLQGFIRQEMETNELTAVLADEELIFFLASAVIVFPIMLAFIWLSSHW
ncbi:hypothetical protein Cgig2_031644 [Carnegiea gigantea]|uniref:Uncharacterized protein n=1 Tax=Carnegiea gigantea TaxID=171969 RepID=A0A9Q1JVI5_9CARY|nr:hypothetical protein Cgig2_031644 [Carnegiea gigantea]